MAKERFHWKERGCNIEYIIISIFLSISGSAKKAAYRQNGIIKKIVCPEMTGIATVGLF